MLLPNSELDQLIKSRFKQKSAVMGRLSPMIEKAQKFEDFKGAESSKTKKMLRMTETSSVTDQLKTELAELRKQMASLQASLEKKSTTVQSSKKSFVCWNCGG